MNFLLILLGFHVIIIETSFKVLGEISNYEDGEIPNIYRLVEKYNKTSAEFHNSEILLEIHETKYNSLRLLNPLVPNENFTEKLSLQITYETINTKIEIKSDIVQPIPNILVDFNDTKYFNFNITGKKIGSVYLGINSSDLRFENKVTTYCHVQVVYSRTLAIVGDVIGWCYFVAWTISFYPQLVLNAKRKSVVGLNFDFLSYNWIGFMAYSAFNVALFWIRPIQDMYKMIYPIGVIPVQLNDVIFALHAWVIITIQIIQCFIYKSNGQKVSKLGWGVTSCMVIYIVIIATVAAVGVRTFTWMDFLYYLSYLKLFTTLIKYTPQAFMNYRMKSTVGWSITGIYLDFTGGFLSILQMFILSYNNDDWKQFFGDPTKFGLGLISMLYDVVFFVQHYILYRKPKPKQHPEFEDEEPLIVNSE